VRPAALVATAAAAALAASCKVKELPPITATWHDQFARDSLGPEWNATGKGYQLVDGALSARGAHNHPLWLRRKLPRDVRIELDVWSNDEAGDLKLEVFGDGSSYDANGGAYKSTGYVLIFGGWHNSKSMIARQDEHGKEAAERTLPRVVAKQKYHWRIERSGRRLSWFIDDLQAPFLEYVDPRPLEGEGHEAFAINNWETDTYFDNLTITPL
jgi:hypothetical protein